MGTATEVSRGTQEEALGSLMYIKREELGRDVVRMGEDIIRSARFEKAWSIPHHSKEGNVALHSLSTAACALRYARQLAQRGTVVSEVDLVRAALLHDIGMTEDDVFFSPSRLKAYTHPQEGCRIAREEYGVNDLQADAILHHMWPIGHIPPHSAEGWLIVAADKTCAIHEVERAFLHKLQHPSLRLA